MNSDKIKLEIITPHKNIFAEEIKGIRLPGVSGYFGVLPGHTPFLAALKVGEIKVQDETNTFYFATSGGFVEVLNDNVTILAETAESADDVDTKRAEEAKERARNRLKEGRKVWESNRARAALLRAINRIQVASKH